MGKSDGKCKICLTVDETLHHLLVNCCKTESLQQKVEDFLLRITNHNVILNTENIMLGVQRYENEEYTNMHILNNLLFMLQNGASGNTEIMSNVEMKT